MPLRSPFWSRCKNKNKIFIRNFLLSQLFITLEAFQRQTFRLAKNDSWDGKEVLGGVDQVGVNQEGVAVYLLL